VRSVGAVEHELALESSRAFTSTDLLAEGIVARMLAGLSTRRYAAGLEPVGAEVDEQAAGTSKSAVSRRFVAATAERLEQLLGRRPDEQRWLIVSWTGSASASTCWLARLGSPTTAPRSRLVWPRAPPRTRRCVPGWSATRPSGAWTPAAGCCSWSMAATRT
jgi:putative transposase